MRDSTRSNDAEQRLRIYLNDHRAGSTAGRALARRCADANEGEPLGQYLRHQFLPELEEESAYVDSLMKSLSFAASPVKQALARAGEFVGRLKLNGQLTGYSPLSRLEELEMLIAGVNAKRLLWRSLDSTEHSASTSDDLGPAEFLARADAQLATLEAHHLDAAGEAFDS